MNEKINLPPLSLDYAARKRAINRAVNQIAASLDPVIRENIKAIEKLRKTVAQAADNVGLVGKSFEGIILDEFHLLPLAPRLLPHRSFFKRNSGRGYLR